MKVLKICFAHVLAGARAEYRTGGNGENKAASALPPAPRTPSSTLDTSFPHLQINTGLPTNSKETSRCECVVVFYFVLSFCLSLQ